MYKPRSLREHLTAANPHLRQNPENLTIFADAGNVMAASTASLSFQYRYTLNVIVTDYSGDIDALVVPLMAWVAVHQYDLLDDQEKRQSGISFEVDFNNHITADISIKIALSERVIVKAGEAGRLDVTHSPEPQRTPAYNNAFWTAYNGETLLAEWHIPAAT